MNIKELDNDLKELIKTRSELLKINYNSPQYDELEEKLHDAEDDFQDQYGEYLEEILQDVHDEHCPDSDVLIPIAYLAKKYLVSKKGEYGVDAAEGVLRAGTNPVAW